MDNTKKDQKIITDPEKLKKQIRRSGTIGIILGIIVIVLTFLAMAILELGIENLIINSVIGVIYIVFGLKIRKNPTSCAKELKFTFCYSIVLAVLGFVLSGGANPGWLLIIYIWILKDSMKFQKRLNEQLQPIN